MLFIVRFTDKPESLPLRQELLPSHLQWLQQHQTAILVAGSLRTEPSTAPVGACWVVEAQSKSEVVALFQADPFWEKRGQFSTYLGGSDMVTDSRYFSFNLNRTDVEAIKAGNAMKVAGKYSNTGWQTKSLSLIGFTSAYNLMCN